MIFWWIRAVPINIAKKIAAHTAENRGLAIVYIGVAFFLIPLMLIYLME